MPKLNKQIKCLVLLVLFTACDSQKNDEQELNATPEMTTPVESTEAVSQTPEIHSESTEAPAMVLVRAKDPEVLSFLKELIEKPLQVLAEDRHRYSENIEYYGNLYCAIVSQEAFTLQEKQQFENSIRDFLKQRWIADDLTEAFDPSRNFFIAYRTLELLSRVFADDPIRLEKIRNEISELLLKKENETKRLDESILTFAFQKNESLKQHNFLSDSILGWLNDVLKDDPESGMIEFYNYFSSILLLPTQLSFLKGQDVYIPNKVGQKKWMRLMHGYSSGTIVHLLALEIKCELNLISQGR
jgi:hypothetical protein